MAEATSAVAVKTGPNDGPPKIRKTSHARDYGKGFWIKLILVGLINAVGVYGVFLALEARHTVFTVGVIVILVVVNLVYFLPSQRLIPLKYLLPGLIFLLIYQIFVIGYTGFTAFTNYGDGHNSTKEAAIASILRDNEVRVPETPMQPISVVQIGDSLGFAYVDDDGQAHVGYHEHHFEVLDEATIENNRVTDIPNGSVLTFAQISGRGQEVASIRVPISDDPNDGSMRTQDGSNGFLARSIILYDEDNDRLIHTQDGTIFTANDTGSFESEDGVVLTPGWKVNVGFDNFTTIFTGGKISSEFFSVLLWTIVFAFLSVATTFLAGLALALVFNSESMRGRKIYRSLLILPYAFPGFLSALVWAGLLNRDHGFINNILFGGASIPWLTDPFLAKVSIIGVNLWLGFPYMFLICMGALQSIDKSLYESARVDGASPWRQSRSITFPLLMVSTAPLLISSFAFNFNNFNLIYMLTDGGPKDLSSSTGVGATDILVTYTYKVAFSGGLNQHGLASAISIMIFIIVATISIIGFRQTRKLEELM